MSARGLCFSPNCAVGRANIQLVLTSSANQRFISDSTRCEIAQGARPRTFTAELEMNVFRHCFVCLLVCLLNSD